MKTSTSRATTSERLALFPRVVRDARVVAPSAEGRVVVIGNLDGVHLGHRRVLERAAERARRGPHELAVLTFEPHPAAVLGGSAPQRLTRLTRKVELLGRHGADLIVAQKFDHAFAALSPEAFVDVILVQGLSARVVVVGHDFRFGARRAGDLEVLRTLGRSGKGRSFDVEVQEVVADERGPLSSTRVRASLANGDLDDVQAVLGRPHAIEGVVVTGDKRGRTIGFPTANVGEIEEALPAHGVYAVVVDLARSDSNDFRAFARGVANVGLRPTIAGGGVHPSVEVHLFDLPEGESDLYGDALRVHFVARLREERRFPGLDALKAQIAADAAQARTLTAEIPRPDLGCWF
jgi:riboflavin kinase/FMN adenylyltransferase